MAVSRAIVLLFANSAGQSMGLKNAPWYVQYFFNPGYGQAAYWSKQSDNDIILAGEVSDWVFVEDPLPSLMDRTAVINAAIRLMENNHGFDFQPFDMVFLVLGIPPSIKSDGGSTTAKSQHRSHWGIVARTGDRFDFFAHEIGHGVGLDHSFGSPSFKIPYGQPGEYGHPYCVMSAMSYGGRGGPYFPAPPRDGRNEYSGLGPSLNAATALARGWVIRQPYDLGAPPAEFELRSRHWLGRSQPLAPAVLWFGDKPQPAPQAVEIRVPNGQNFVVEFREPEDWDRGQSAPLLIVNHGKGSTADLAYPNTHAATYLGQVTLPLTFGAVGTVYNGSGFGIEVLDRSTAEHTLRIRISSGIVRPTPMQLDHTDQVLSSRTVETGTTTFEAGERLCLEGVWNYSKVAHQQVAIFEATYALTRPPITASWVVDGGEPLADNGGTITLSKNVAVANPDLTPQDDLRSVEVRYEIEPLPNGSRLRLFNRPDDQTYRLTVQVTLATAVGSAMEVGFPRFTGTEYQYPAEFYAQRDACWKRFRDVGERYVRYKVVLDPRLWQVIPEEKQPEVNRYLEVLAYLRGQKDQRQYQQGVAELARLTGLPSLAPLAVSLKQKSDFQPSIASHRRKSTAQRKAVEFKLAPNGNDVTAPPKKRST